MSQNSTLKEAIHELQVTRQWLQSSRDRFGEDGGDLLQVFIPPMGTLCATSVIKRRATLDLLCADGVRRDVSETAWVVA